MTSRTGAPGNHPRQSRPSVLHSPPVSRRRRVAILAACTVAMLVAQIDSTGVNLALPSVARDLRATTGELQWIVDSYLLVLASLLMFSGALADRAGRRRVFVSGLLIFGLGSALCSISINPLMLIAMRALQAIGGSMLAPVALSIITNTFTDPRERAQAIGVWGAVVGVGMALGPIVGGALVDAVDWRAVFWINLPVLAVTVPAVLAVVPESRARAHRGADAPGQLLAVLTLAALSLAIIEGGETSFTAPGILISFAVALLAGAAFIGTERRANDPMIELRFFRSAPFSLATLMALALFIAYAGFMFVATLYLQDARGLEPLRAGLLTLPMALSSACAAPVSGWLVGRTGARTPMLAGAASLTVGSILLLTLLGPTSPLTLFVIAGMCVGASMGLINTPISNTAVSAMPPERAGVAGATASTSRQVGQALGVAVLGACLNAGIGAGEPFTTAARCGWWIMLACGAGLCVMAVACETARAQRSARRARESW